MQSLAGRIAAHLARLMLAELAGWQLLLLAAMVGVLWAGGLFDWSFVAGRHPFWQHPAGTIRESDTDMAQVLVAYLYYVHSPWNFPLFHVSALGAPVGTNIIMMDPVPIVALLGKLLSRATGTTVNPYGAYLFLCFALPGVMAALALIAVRVRYALAAIVAACFADSLPALLWQWGHIALEAHFLLIGALALYLFSLRQRAWRGLAGVWIGYLILAYLMNLYFFAVVGAVWLCATIQRCLAGLTTARAMLAGWLVAVTAVMIVIVVGGQFSAGSGLPFGPYGRYSMNLVSPIVPQSSFWFPTLGDVVDANGSQYEGFNYLGFGLLLASLLVLPAEFAWLRRNARRHLALLVCLGALTAFAISHRVYAGHRLLFELPLTYDIDRALGTFRSSGRFFWLVAYAQMLVVVVLAFRRARPALALCLAGAVIVQLVDVQPLRHKVVASIAAGPSEGRFDSRQVARVVGRAAYLRVVPSFQCSGFQDPTRKHEQERENMELMLAAARADVPTNTVDLARQSYGLTLRDVLNAPTRAPGMLEARRVDYCSREIDQARSGVRARDLTVLLAERPSQQELPPWLACRPLAQARYCETSGD